jgi:hypothetical protein
MNDRIKELGEQAGITINFDTEYYELNQKFMQKFAELIVFECVKIAVFKGDATTGKAIKEHFGVEL